MAARCERRIPGWVGRMAYIGSYFLRGPKTDGTAVETDEADGTLDEDGFDEEDERAESLVRAEAYLHMMHTSNGAFMTRPVKYPD